ATRCTKETSVVRCRNAVGSTRRDDTSTVQPRTTVDPRTSVGLPKHRYRTLRQALPEKQWRSWSGWSRARRALPGSAPARGDRRGHVLTTARVRDADASAGQHLVHTQGPIMPASTPAAESTCAFEAEVIQNAPGITPPATVFDLCIT